MKKLILLLVVVSAISCKTQNPVDIRDSVIGTYNCTVHSLDVANSSTAVGTMIITKVVTENRVNLLLRCGVPDINILCDVKSLGSNSYSLNIVSGQTNTYISGSQSAIIYLNKCTENADDGLILNDNSSVSFRYKFTYNTDVQRLQYDGKK